MLIFSIIFTKGSSLLTVEREVWVSCDYILGWDLINSFVIEIMYFVYEFDPINHIHICQVLLQLSYNDTGQIWQWYSTGNQFFSYIENGKQNQGHLV